MNFFTNRDKIKEINSYQAYILAKAGINLTTLDNEITYLEQLGKSFSKPFLGVDSLSLTSLELKQNLILSVLYYHKEEIEKSKSLKLKADNIFVWLKADWCFVEGFSSFLSVKNAYKFYHQMIHKHNTVGVDLQILENIHLLYKEISAPDGSILTNNTNLSDKFKSDDRIDYSNRCYSTHNVNNEQSFVFVSHGTHLPIYKNNINVSYDFGHFCVFHGNEWVIKHRYKQIPNNVIIGPNKSSVLSHEKRDNIHILNMGDGISRTIEVLNNGIFVKDIGGKYSHFNVHNDLKFGYHGKIKIVGNNKLELHGQNRMFWIEFD